MALAVSAENSHLLSSCDLYALFNKMDTSDEK